MDRETHNALKEVFSLSQEPTGSLLPHKFKTRAVPKEQRNYISRQFGGSTSEITNKIYQIKLVMKVKIIELYMMLILITK